MGKLSMNKQIRKLAIQNILRYKKRSWSIVITICLAALLFTMLCMMVASIGGSWRKDIVSGVGAYHLGVSDVEDIDYFESNIDIEMVYKAYQVGLASVPELANIVEPQVRIYSMEEADAKAIGITVMEGRFPQNNSELLLDEGDLGELDITVGDQVAWSVDGTVNTFTIVGIIAPTHFFLDYDGITTGIERGKADVFVTYKNPLDYKKTTEEILGKEEEYYEYYVENTNLIKIDGLDFSKNEWLIGGGIFIGIVVLITFVTLFSLSYITQLSRGERNHTFGLLKAMGMKEKDFQYLVAFDTYILTGIGVLAGMILGTLLTIISIWVLQPYISYWMDLEFHFSVISLIGGGGLAFIPSWLSVRYNRWKLSKSTPVGLMRGEVDALITKKKRVDRRHALGVSGALAENNRRVFKKRYRATSLSIGGSVFLILTTLLTVEIITHVLYAQIDNISYDVMIYGVEEEMSTKEEYIALTESELVDGYEIGYNYYGVEYEIGKSYKTQNHPSKSLNVIHALALEDESFRNYAEKIGADYEEVHDKGILVNMVLDEEDGEIVIYRNLTSYQPGDVIEGRILDSNEPCSLELGYVTEDLSYTAEYIRGISPHVVVNNKYFSQYEYGEPVAFIETEKPEEYIRWAELLEPSFYFVDESRIYEEQLITLQGVSFLLYFFLFMICCMSISMIINVSSANISLRKKEFAMLHSIGIGKNDLKRMILLEQLAIAIKALTFALLGSGFIAYLVLQLLGTGIKVEVDIPFAQVLIVVAVVVALQVVHIWFMIRSIEKESPMEVMRSNRVH